MTPEFSRGPGSERQRFDDAPAAAGSEREVLVERRL